MTATRNILVFMGTRPEAVKLAPGGGRAARRQRLPLHRGGHRPAQGDVPPGRRHLRLRGRRRPRRDAPQPDPGGADRPAHGRHRRLAGIGPAGHGAGAGRHHDRAGGIAGLLLPAHPDRPRRGRAAHRQHLVALPRGSEPQAGHAAGGAPLRAHRGGARGAAPRGRPGGDHLGDGQHRHRRAAHRGRAPGQRRGAARTASTRS